MISLVMYDVEADKVRTKLAKSLKAIGLHRIQKSVFGGKVRPKLLKDTLKQYQAKLEEGDRLYAIRLQESQLRQMYCPGWEGNWDVVLGKLEVLCL